MFIVKIDSRSPEYSHFGILYQLQCDVDASNTTGIERALKIIYEASSITHFKTNPMTYIFIYFDDPLGTGSLNIPRPLTIHGVKNHKK